MPRAQEQPAPGTRGGRAATNLTRSLSVSPSRADTSTVGRHGVGPASIAASPKDPFVSHPRQSHRTTRTTPEPPAAGAPQHGARGGRSSRRSTVLIGVIAAIVALAAAGVSVGFAQSGRSVNAPLVPPTNDAPSPFAADPGSSLPVGLVPNETVTPLVAPQQPVVLSWNPVPGAVSYTVEISSSPGFSKTVWSQSTDQPQVAPNIILADGTYWWRVTAFDTAGTRGITSAVATFAKQWDGTVTGGVLSDTPGGAPASLIRVTPYLSWNAVPGAAYYQAQIAPGNQFAAPVFDSGLVTQTGIAPGDGSVLPDGNYIWRVRAFDAANNPGPWTVESSYTKAWVAPTTTAPADGATVDNFELTWNPVPGASSYDVQVTKQEYNFTSGELVVDSPTASAAYVPDLAETQSHGIGPGQYWWRVRPVVDGVVGTWSPVDTFTYATPTVTSSVPTLSSDTTASTTALTPVLSWTPVTGAEVYRIDIATDSQFNNIVFSDLTTDTAWAMRTPLPDNQVNGGYYWRVVWGANADPTDPDYLVDETLVPTATFTKQTQPTVGTAATGVVTAPPLFTWSDIPGAGQYQLQVSRDQQFADSSTESMTVFGLGTWWNDSQGSPLTSGTWYWRVRPIDDAGNSLTYNAPPQSFVINPPAPTPSAPANGATVIASPELSWNPVNGACSYDVQVSDSSTFPAADGGSGGSIPDGANTAQTAYVPTGSLVTHAGTWYWRVRAELCNTDTGAWSDTQTFISHLPPQFNLNTIPTRVAYGTRIVVAGQLVANGSPVANPTLILERRLYPSTTYSPVAAIAADGSGRFAFALSMTRSADWQLRWSGNLPFDEGIASFDVTVLPRVSFTLTRSRVVRGHTYGVNGFVYPIRPAWIQVEGSGGWSNLVRVPSRERFALTLRARFATGTQHLRLYVPTDTNQTMAPVGSSTRSLFVYDVIVIK